MHSINGLVWSIQQRLDPRWVCCVEGLCGLERPSFRRSFRKNFTIRLNKMRGESEQLVQKYEICSAKKEQRAPLFAVEQKRLGKWPKHQSFSFGSPKESFFYDPFIVIHASNP